MLAVIAVTALILAAQRDSRVARYLVRVAPLAVGPSRWSGVTEADLRHAGVGWSSRRLAIGRIVGAALAGVLGLLVGGWIVAVVLGYTGFVGPALFVERRAAARRREADAEMGTLLERVEALAAAGKPAELAFASIAARPSGAALLESALRAASSGYALGAPFFPTLAEAARDHGLPRLADVAQELDRSRDLGRGSLTVLLHARDVARAAERTRALAAASAVESRLMLVLVLCYLPALVLAVIVPLFLGLLDGLFG